jgi:hypothetical protein
MCPCAAFSKTITSDFLVAVTHSLCLLIYTASPLPCAACQALLQNFNGGGSTSQSLLMSTLIADLTQLQELENANRPSAEKQCEMKQKWADHGADISSIKITFFRPPPGQETNSATGDRVPVTAGAMFTAGPSTYVVIGWNIGYNFNTAPDALVPYKVSCLLLLERA